MSVAPKGVVFFENALSRRTFVGLIIIEPLIDVRADVIEYQWYVLIYILPRYETLRRITIRV